MQALQQIGAQGQIDLSKIKAQGANEMAQLKQAGLNDQQIEKTEKHPVLYSKSKHKVVSTSG